MGYKAREEGSRSPRLDFKFKKKGGFGTWGFGGGTPSLDKKGVG